MYAHFFNIKIVDNGATTWFGWETIFKTGRDDARHPDGVDTTKTL